MITHNNNITLDLSCESPRATVVAKQDDKQSRTVTASFTDGDEKYLATQYLAIRYTE